MGTQVCQIPRLNSLTTCTTALGRPQPLSAFTSPSWAQTHSGGNRGDLFTPGAAAPPGGAPDRGGREAGRAGSAHLPITSAGDRPSSQLAKLRPRLQATGELLGGRWRWAWPGLSQQPGIWPQHRRRVKGVESIRAPRGWVGGSGSQWGALSPAVPSPNPCSKSVRDRGSGREREAQAGTQADGEAGLAGHDGRERPRAARQPPKCARHRSLTCSSGPVVDPTLGTRSRRLRGAAAPPRNSRSLTERVGREALALGSPAPRRAPPPPRPRPLGGGWAKDMGSANSSAGGVRKSQSRQVTAGGAGLGAGPGGRGIPPESRSRPDAGGARDPRRREEGEEGDRVRTKRPGAGRKAQRQSKTSTCSSGQDPSSPRDSVYPPGNRNLSRSLFLKVQPGNPLHQNHLGAP